MSGLLKIKATNKNGSDEALIKLLIDGKSFFDSTKWFSIQKKQI